MSTISVSNIVDGTTADAADVNSQVNTIVNDYNGNIDNSNIAAAAAIAGTKLADASVTSAKIVGIDKSILTTDSNPYKFSVYRNAAQNSASSHTKISFDTEVYDTNNNFATGTYTCPVAGFYWFCAQAGNTSATATPMQTSIYKNGSVAFRGMVASPDTAANLFSVSCVVQCAANDTIEAYFIGGAGSAMYVGAENCYFQGYLISRT